eukprot:1157794-Pelagomonas_calceolata.AAC.4
MPSFVQRCAYAKPGFDGKTILVSPARVCASRWKPYTFGAHTDACPSASNAHPANTSSGCLLGTFAQLLFFDIPSFLRPAVARCRAGVVNAPTTVVAANARCCCLQSAIEYSKDVVHQLRLNFNISGVVKYKGADAAADPWFYTRLVDQAMSTGADAILGCDFKVGCALVE